MMICDESISYVDLKKLSVEEYLSKLDIFVRSLES